MKSTVNQFGILFFGLGVLAIVMNYMNMVPKILAWIYLWGENTAWIIKIAFVVLGAILWLIALKMKEPVQK